MQVKCWQVGSIDLIPSLPRERTQRSLETSLSAFALTKFSWKNFLKKRTEATDYLHVNAFANVSYANWKPAFEDTLSWSSSSEQVIYSVLFWLVGRFKLIKIFAFIIEIHCRHWIQSLKCRGVKWKKKISFWHLGVNCNKCGDVA